MKIILPNELIRTIGIESENYPELLKKIPDRPEKLFVRGEIAGDEIFFGIVGTRRASDYGKEIAFSFAKQLTKEGITIVSGMALGIDSFAHQGALAGNGKTIAVLATGLNQKTIYPQTNLKLAAAILEQKGALISEYEPDNHGACFTFLQRNRIIAGMSLGVLVVEAKIKSGALNTAHWAKKQGRKVFAIPGPIFNINSRGCHLLLKQGAILTENVNDILRAMALPPRARQVIANPQNNQEKIIGDVLKNGALDIEQIIEKTGLAARDVSRALSVMELEDRVKTLGGNTYALTR